ncbi:hypothetical protein [Halalkalibaculum sp. DA384]|uniref:hypothetical protein n=1 Tax=Halalkalibaculum sp. DA384 TaxID=3373606 RepID=UPI003754DD7E
MLKKIRKTAGRYLVNIPGWRTDRKIVVIESDDWGSIRMPSREVYEQCLQAGYRVDTIAYERYDSLASEKDLELLFELLNQFRDCHGNPAVLTANVLVANPDFERIKNGGFSDYFYEPVTETFQKYPGHSNCFDYWKQGMEAGLFYPQSHGREHLNVSMFMSALQERDRDAMFGFEHGMPGCIPKGEPGRGNRYVESLRYSSAADKGKKLSIVAEGLDLFEDLFGFRSASFIPPNHIWSPDYDELISQKGVHYYQGRRKMKEPLYDGTIQLNTHYLGQQNSQGQIYLTRNAMFEPSLFKDKAAQVNRCLKDIAVAFKLGKPAIICSHRLNYIGFIDEKNRDENLVLMKKLLREITERWPDVEFMNSVQLGKLIEQRV